MNDGIKGVMGNFLGQSGPEKGSKWIQVILPLSLAGGLALIGILARIITSLGTNEVLAAAAADYTHRFAVGFERIFLEAVPFLLLGALAAAVVKHYFSTVEVGRIFSKSLIPGIAAGLLTGIILPLGEGGSILLARALLKKGAALPSTVVMMLAAPALNVLPLAILLGAGGASVVFWLRVGIGAVFAILFGILLSFENQPERLIHPGILRHQEVDKPPVNGAASNNNQNRLKAVAVSTAKEFLEFTPYVIAAALLAAILQTIMPQSWIPPVQGGLASQIGSSGLWALLSSQSNLGDILTIQNSAISWPVVSQLVFLTLGILVDVKLVVLYFRVLRGKAVFYLIALAIGTAVLTGLFIGI